MRSTWLLLNVNYMFFIMLAPRGIKDCREKIGWGARIKLYGVLECLSVAIGHFLTFLGGLFRAIHFAILFVHFGLILQSAVIMIVE